MARLNFRKDKIPFTQVANEVLYDTNLSFKAKGLYSYLYSKPDGWNFAIDRIAKETKEGRLAVNSGLKELEENGYLLRERQSTGRVIYLLKSQMSKIDMGQGEPNVENRKVRKPQSAKTDTVSNTEEGVILSNSNKENNHEKIVGLIDAFAEVNPSYRKWYANKTQRAAAARLLETFSQEDIFSAIKVLPRANKEPYFPTIVTPAQLEDKWVQLDSAIQRRKALKRQRQVIW